MKSNNCTDCKLHIQRKKVIHGQGKFYDPRLFIVGEAPGREEDDSGKPFVGGAGRILNAMLADAGIGRQDCFVTNVCKCRPPNNRTPELDEIFACQDSLAEEIEKVNPRVIVALGDTATTLLTGRSVGTYRGSIVNGIGPATGRRVLITYHPSFVMRMRSMFPVVAWDLRKAANYQPIAISEQYSFCPDRGEVASWFQHIQDHQLEVAVDIETAGDKEEGNKDDALDPYTGSIIGIAFCWGQGQAMQLDYNNLVKNWDLVTNFLSSYPKQIYANNSFDRLFCWVSQNCRPQLYWDVQTAMHRIYPAMPKKLDFLRSIYTDLPPYKQIYREQAGGKYRPEKLSPDSLARLNCLDVDVTWQVCQEQKKFITEAEMLDVWREEEIALEMIHRGAYIDQNNLATHYAKILPQIEAYEKKFSDIWECSVSSPKQLNSVLYDRILFPLYDDKGKSCERGKASTNEKAIQAIGSALGLVYCSGTFPDGTEDPEGERFEGEAKNKEILSDILDYRGMAKIASTYCEGLFRSIKQDGRVHPSWKVTGTATGRWSCKGVPMQGVPKDLRNIIRAEPGKILMGADYKGMQIMGAGVLAQDWELCNLMLNPEYSIHNQVLEAIKPYYPSIKKIQAKTVVFGKFFGRSDRDIAVAFHVPVKVVNQWTDIFYSLRPKLRELFEEKFPQQWKELDYVLGIDGHKLYATSQTEAKNYPVQNFETRVVKVAMWKLREEGYNLVLNGHDQLVCEEPDDHTKDARFKRFCEIMETARPDLLPKFPIDPGMSYYWNEV